MQRDARAFLWDAHSAAEAILEFVAGKTYKPKKSSWHMLWAVRAEQCRSMDGPQHTHPLGE